MVNGSGLTILREFQALALFRSHLQLKIYKLVFTYYEDIYRYPVTHLFNTVYVGLPDDRDTQESSVSCQRNHCEHARTGAGRHLYSTSLHRDSGMRKITLLLAALSFSLLADTRIYQCDMTVSRVKNDQTADLLKLNSARWSLIAESSSMSSAAMRFSHLHIWLNATVNWLALALARTSLSTTNPTTSTAFIAKTKVSFSTDVRRLVNGSHNDWSGD